MSYRIIEADGSEIMERYSVGRLAAKLLEASGFEEEQLQDLFNTTDQLTQSRCEAVDACCARIMRAKQNQEKVFVAGDYDADGICSTAIMKDTLDRLGIPNGYYIPDRFREGYGLSADTVKAAHAKGYHLIITVDNGVKCMEAIDTAHALGMEIIVTDHHEIEEPVPCDLLVHPSVMEEKYRYLSGAGVVLQLSLNLLGEIPPHVALAAIALIGDVMPLWKETRRIVRRGCLLISRGALPSIEPLLRKGAEINETALGFQVVPKLNSVGRMNDRSNVNNLVPYLISTDPAHIAAIASQLNRVNDKRRRVSDDTVRKAERLPHDMPFPILFEESFQEGIVGLAAGKLSRQWQKPVLVFAKSESVYKGSGRSIPGLNLFEFLREFEEPCAFGGHAMAVGVSVPEEKFEDFILHVNEKMDQVPFDSRESREPAVLIQETDLTADMVMELESLRPFPKEMITKTAILNPQLLSVQSYDRVTRYHFRGFDGVLFSGSAPAEDAISCLIGSPGINRFRDRITVQIVIDAFGETD